MRYEERQWRLQQRAMKKEGDLTYRQAVDQTEATLFEQAVSRFMGEIDNRGMGIRPISQRDRIEHKLEELKHGMAQGKPVELPDKFQLKEVFIAATTWIRDRKEMRIAGQYFPRPEEK